MGDGLVGKQGKLDAVERTAAVSPFGVEVLGALALLGIVAKIALVLLRRFEEGSHGF